MVPVNFPAKIETNSWGTVVTTAYWRRLTVTPSSGPDPEVFLNVMDLEGVEPGATGQAINTHLEAPEARALAYALLTHIGDAVPQATEPGAKGKPDDDAVAPTSATPGGLLTVGEVKRLGVLGELAKTLTMQDAIAATDYVLGYPHVKQKVAEPLPPPPGQPSEPFKPWFPKKFWEWTAPTTPQAGTATLLKSDGTEVTIDLGKPVPGVDETHLWKSGDLAQYQAVLQKVNSQLAAKTKTPEMKPDPPQPSVKLPEGVTLDWSTTTVGQAPPLAAWVVADKDGDRMGFTALPAADTSTGDEDAYIFKIKPHDEGGSSITRSQARSMRAWLRLQHSTGGTTSEREWTGGPDIEMKYRGESYNGSNQDWSIELDGWMVYMDEDDLGQVLAVLDRAIGTVNPPTQGEAPSGGYQGF